MKDRIVGRNSRITSRSVIRRGALFALLGAVVFSGCEDHVPVRENLNVQNAVLTQERLGELGPAEGSYSGRVRLLRSNQTYAAELTIKRVRDIVRATQPDQPTDTVEVPKLVATLTFPSIERAASRELPKYKDLLLPMGNMRRLIVDYGNFYPATHALTLPYMVPGYAQGPYGELAGELSGDRFTGTWFAKPLGDVATFEFIKQ